MDDPTTSPTRLIELGHISRPLRPPWRSRGWTTRTPPGRHWHHSAVGDIRPATIADLPGAYRVCLLTGDEGADASGLYANPDLLGHVYVGPYVVGEPGHALVVADRDGVAGYCLAARDTDAFAAWAEREWWPPLRRWFPERPGE